MKENIGESEIDGIEKKREWKLRRRKIIEGLLRNKVVIGKRWKKSLFEKEVKRKIGIDERRKEIIKKEIRREKEIMNGDEKGIERRI